MYHLEFYLDTPKAPYEKGVSDLWSFFFFFFNSMLWFTYKLGRRKKASEGLNVVVKAEAGMCPLFLCPFVGHDG